MQQVSTFPQYGHWTTDTFGAFHLVCTQFYMLSGPTHPLFACNTQWKCTGGLTPPTHLGAYVLNGRPIWSIWYCMTQINVITLIELAFIDS